MSDFSKESGYLMSNQERKTLVDNYLESAGEGAPRSEFFGKKFLKQLMKECRGDSTGVRVAFGRDVNGLRLIINPCDANGKDLPIPLHLQGLKDDPSSGGGGSNTRCPSACG